MTDTPEWLQTYPPAQRAALMVHLDEIGRRGGSELPHNVVAELAGVARSAVVIAVATGWARGHLIVTAREGEPSVIRLSKGVGGQKSTGSQGS